jgi:hypothetical protein
MTSDALPFILFGLLTHTALLSSPALAEATPTQPSRKVITGFTKLYTGTQAVPAGALSKNPLAIEFETPHSGTAKIKSIAPAAARKKLHRSRLRMD